MQIGSNIIVGRNKELELLSDFLARTMMGNGQVVFVSGEAGIGKTSVVNEFLRMVDRIGCSTFESSCPRQIVTPYQPFQEIATSMRSVQNEFMDSIPRVDVFDKDRHQLKAGQQGTVGGLAKRETALFDMLDLVADLSSRKTCLIVIEDLQWADSMTIQMIHFLSRNIDGRRIMLLGTYRSEEINAMHGLPQTLFIDLLRLLRRERKIGEIDLGPLSEEHIGKAINLLMDYSLDKDILRRIVKESEGNPLYAIEVFRYLVDGGLISSRDGVWGTNTREFRIVIPESLREMIEPRISRLSDEERKAIEFASVFEGPINPNILSRTLKIPLIDLLESLDILCERSKLLEPRDDGYRFVHDLIRHTINDEIPYSRRIVLHQAVANSLLEQDDVVSSAEHLAYHYWEAKSYLECAKWSLLAGNRCLVSDAPTEALFYFERADASLDMIKTDPDSLDFQIKFGKARSLRMLGRMAEAGLVFEKCLDSCHNGAERASALWNLADCYRPMYLGQGDPARCKALLEEAEKIQDAYLIDKGEIASSRAYISMEDESLSEAEPYFDLAEIMFEASGDVERLITQICSRALAYLIEGDVNKALLTMNRTNKFGHSLKISTEVEISYRYCFIYLASGDYENASKWFDRCQDLSTKLGENTTLWSIHLYRSLMYDQIGEHVASEIEASEGRALAEVIGSPYNLAASNAVLIHSLLRNGNLGKSAITLNEMEEALGTLTMNMRSPTWGFIFAARGEMAAYNRDDTGMRELFKQSIDILDNSHFHHLHGAIARTWFGDRLIEQGNIQEAVGLFKEAILLYRHIGNLRQISKLERMIASVSGIS